MSYAFCIVSVAPIRVKPEHEAEMCSQLLFGEHVEILSAPVKGFVEISCSHDGYKGFCAVNQLLETKEGYITSHALAGNWLNTMYDRSGHVIRIPFGSPLPEVLREYFDFSSIDSWDTSTFSEDKLLEIVGIYMNSPYLWGGRSVFGLDCSGFSQAVARIFGVSLLRDAWQQAEAGKYISYGKHSAGDLAFFDLDGTIVHVGVITGLGEIAHAFGKIRKDDFTEAGIMNRDTGLITHSLHSIKRIL